MADYDDCKTLRELYEQFNNVTKMKNQAVDKYGYAEIKLNRGIIEENISEKYTWKKQVLELCKKQQCYIVVMEDYYMGKKDEKYYTNLLKSIENQSNAIKKIYETTP